MKKYIINICTVAIAILSVISCTNESVEIKKQVQITISPSKVLKDIVPFYNPSDIDMYQEEGNAAKLKLIALIYDKNGNLYHKSEKIVKDYNSDYTFSILVDEEEYRILAFSYSVLEIDGETHSAYSISNTDKQNNLKIQQERSNSYYSNWSVLGMEDITTAISDHTHIDLSMATANVSFEWLNIHSNTNASSGPSAIYGEYTASATDYWGKNHYSWKISVEKDATRPNGVVVKDLCPALYNAGVTSVKGQNTYYGYIEDDFLIIESGQKSGVSTSDGEVSIKGLFEFEDGLDESDIIFFIEEGMLMSATYFGSWNEGGWFSLFEPGLIFNSAGSSGGSQGIDSYTYWHKWNNILTFTNNGYEYSTTLGIDTYRTEASVEPAKNPDAENIYKLFNLLPGTFEIFIKESIGNDSETYGKRIITLEAGKQYTLEYNCKTKEINFVSSNSKTRSTTNTFVRKINKPFKLYYYKELEPVSQHPLFSK